MEPVRIGLEAPLAEYLTCNRLARHILGPQRLEHVVHRPILDPSRGQQRVERARHHRGGTQCAGEPLRLARRRCVDERDP
ncbi:hypothetical protein D3C81_1019450 [compost metagenome]